MDWTERKAEEARKVLERWTALTEGVEPSEPLDAAVSALADDLNTPGAIAAMHEAARAADRRRLLATMVLMGINRIVVESGSVSADVEAQIEGLIAARAEARGAKDFARADAIRDAFAAAGVVVKDTADGATWELSPEFDAGKLEGVL